ncbi:NDR1/HIN1-like protein [Amycolatopsis sp. NPDC005003]
MRKISKRSAVVLGAAGVVVVAGVAYAAWTSTGAGTGSVSSTTSVNSVIQPGTGGGLYPGGSTTFTVTIDNPNDYPVKVDSISAGKSNAIAETACAAETVTSDASPNAGTIAAHGSTTFTLQAHMIANPDNSCQGKTFTLPLTAALSSNAS